jgi:hypothetical protein
MPLRPLSRAPVSRDSGATPRASRGKWTLVHCREYSNGATLPDKIGVETVVRLVGPITAFGPFSAQEPFNGGVLLELRSQGLLDTCFTDHRSACGSEFLLYRTLLLSRRDSTAQFLRFPDDKHCRGGEVQWAPDDGQRPRRRED